MIRRIRELTRVWGGAGVSMSKAGLVWFTPQHWSERSGRVGAGTRASKALFTALGFSRNS